MRYARRLNKRGQKTRLLVEDYIKEHPQESNIEVGNALGFHRNLIGLYRIQRRLPRSNYRQLIGILRGCPLQENEIVHHRDGDRRNNLPENLEVIKAQDHDRIHHGKLTGIHCITCRCLAEENSVRRTQL